LFVPLSLLVGYYLIRMSSLRLRKVLAEKDVEADYVLLFVRLYQVLTYTILAFTTLSILHVPLTAFAFVSGALAIGVGFGAQNILNNFISGWILMWERPIRIGDFLEIDDVKGTVETISARSTRIRRVDGVHMLVPNSFLLENTVVNWTLVDRMARGQVRIGVAYGSPVRKVQELIMQAASEQDIVHDDPASVVLFEDFGDNALIFDLYFWIDTFGEKDLRVIKSEIRFRIEELMNENNIVIAFPQRDVHIDGYLKISQEGVEINPDKAADKALAPSK
jgi:small-conductance mechanosensitive channel